MCGINGFNFEDQELITKMNDKIRHRGPDDEGFYIDQNISLGHRRLSIIDLSENGKQPVFNEDKSLVVIFNGEIYNYRELKAELAAKHSFYTQTDTEVLVHLYEDYGHKMLEKLNGIFTFAIWDKKKEELFLARDRIGVKPVYYLSRNGKLVFSSEIKAILEWPQVKREIDYVSLNHYFNLGFVPEPRTMFKDIYILPSAHYLILKNGEMAIKKYWEVNDFEEINSREEAKKMIDELVNDSIKRQLISDRPVGIFLSGGIDSNTVLGVARKYASGKINTYNVGFEQKHGDKFNADARLAKLSGEYYQTDHHQLIISEKDILDNVEDVIYHLDSPINNATQTAMYLLSKLAKNDVAVDLSGSGGDELFAGYPRYYYHHLIDRWQSLPNWLPKETLIDAISKISGRDLSAKFNSRGLARYREFMFRKDGDINKVIKPEIRRIDQTSQFYQEKFFDNLPENFKGLIDRDFARYSSLIDLRSWLIDFGLILSDKTTMAWGLEERVPILDHRLIELSAKIPTKFKIKGRQTKHLFRSAMAQYLPPHILNEPKRGFFCPISEWLRTGLYDFAKEVLSENYVSSSKEIFDFKEIDRIFEDHVNRRKYNLNLIWGLITFQIWCKKFIENK